MNRSASCALREGHSSTGAGWLSRRTLDCYLSRGSLYGAESGAPGNARVSTATSTWTFDQSQPLRISAIPISELTLKGFPNARVLQRSK
ncbi:hypothetical protein [Pimelobacter simplex]|uniref:hypothetical protein n=1 Tax=Nocardioides simplex TaxID=2045 RepID=UPI003AAF20F0